jgi:PBSX family phage terminase large subunit
MIFHKAQKIVAKSNKRFRVVLCGRRFGKTTLSIYEMIAKAIAKDDRRIAYVAPNYQQARDIAWEQLKRICLPIALKTNEQRLEIEVRTQDGGKSYITLRGWESIETLRGQLFDFLVLDEVASYRNFWTGWHEVIRPTLTDRKGEALFIGTPKGFNHFYDLYNTEDKDYESFHFTSYDNPHIPKEEIDKAKEEIGEDRFAQEYMADFRKMEGLVYKEFDRERHVGEQSFIGSEEVICGIDFGYTNPSAILKIVRNNDNYHVEEEWYQPRVSTDQIASVAIKYNPVRVYPDPAEPDRIEQLRDKGLYVEHVSKDIVAGIDTVHALLKQGRLSVSPKCTNLIYEFETYCYPDSKGDRNEEEKPTKMNDHALDALRYALYSEERTPSYINTKHKTNY